MKIFSALVPFVFCVLVCSPVWSALPVHSSKVGKRHPIILKPKPKKRIRLAQSISTVESWIVKAREAFSQAELDRMEKALNEADAALRREEKSLSKALFDNYFLWLNLLWSKFHRVKGLLPPMEKLERYESDSQVKAQLSLMKVLLRHQQEELKYVKLYNTALKRLIRRSKLKDAITLVASMSRQGILENRVQIVQLRIFRLKVILQLREVGGAKNKQKLNRLQKELKLQGKLFAKIRKRQQKTRLSLRKQALAVQQARKMLVAYRHDLINRASRGRTLTWVGVAAMVVGLGVGVTGILMGISSEQQKLSGELNITQYNSAITLARSLGIGGGVVFLGGGVALLYGRLIIPSDQAMDRGVFRSQKKYLDWEEDEKNKKKLNGFLFPKRKSSPKKLPAPFLPKNSKNVLVLGKWGG